MKHRLTTALVSPLLCLCLTQAGHAAEGQPAAAALHNLKALLTLKCDPAAKAAARAELEAALAMTPDYEIAKRNLAGLFAPAPAAPATVTAPAAPATPSPATTGP